MERQIVSIPVKPVIRHLGHLVIPFILEVIRNNLNYKGTLFLNLLGVKNSERMVGDFRKRLREFRLCPDNFLTDENYAFLKYAEQRIREMIENKKITVETKRVWICDCGTVEFLERADMFSHTRRLINSNSECLKCKSQIRLVRQNVLLYRIPVINSSWVAAFPNFLRQEMINLWKRFEGREILISRTKRGIFFKDIGFRIDVDFIWSFMLSYIQQINLLPTIVVSSIKNIWASLLLLFQVDVKNSPLFVFPPYLKASQGSHVKTLRILERCDPQMVRILLGSVMDWTRKEARVDESLIKAIAKLKLDSQMFFNGEQEGDIESFLVKKFNAKFIRTLITKKESKALSFIL